MATDNPQLLGSAPVLERRISERAFLGHYALSAVAGVAILAGCLMTLPWLLPIAAIPAAGVWAYSRLARMGSSYRLYPDRVEIDSGILSRSIENIELFRVRDVGLRQGVIGRFADFGDVYLHSTDSSTPALHFRSIDAPKEFYEQIRARVAANRAQNRTLIVEEGQTLPEP